MRTHCNNLCIVYDSLDIRDVTFLFVTQILKHLDLIDDPQASETIAYLHKVLKVSGYRPLTGSTSDTSGVNSKTSEGDKKPMNSPTPDLLLGVQVT